jgi:hypothetical protein
MKGFHIDMNGLLYKKEYLKQWLTKLAADGYDTILWELENGVQWNTCPESNDSDALSKIDFKEILKHAKEIGLESIPLLQTIGHAEYVLKNKEYHYLAENIAEQRQYCPLNPDTLGFIHQWIHEYLELFGSIRFFHIGADEAYDLGFCPKCQKKAQESSLSELYIDYINAVIKPILNKNITPIVWGDMILHHHEALSKLDKRIMIYDWMYATNKDSKKIHVWGDGWFEPDQINERAKNTFGKFIFTKDKKPYDPFYTSAFLTKNEFKTAICPGSSSYGDTVFAPAWFHLANSFDYMQKSKESHLEGFMLTSWTVHLLPWELQNICVSMNKFLTTSPKGNFAEYQVWYTENVISCKSNSFWKAIELISTPMPLALTRDIGHSKDNFVTPEDAILKSITKYLKDQSKDELVNKMKKHEKDISQALGILKEIKIENNKNTTEIDTWFLAGLNLLNRAKSVIAILEGNEILKKELIAETIICKVNYKKFLTSHLQPKRLKDTTDRLFDPLIFALQK